MGDMLTQAEIDALLNGTSSSDEPVDSFGEFGEDTSLSTQEIDALGEIGNISMGTSATTLFTLLSQKVTITTPSVSVTTWDELAKHYSSSFVAVKVEYTDGLKGSNLLILKQDDVKIITDLMMGGSGVANEGDLSDLHLSAISEAMNQMIGSSATSMSSMFSKRIDISPPKAFVVNFGEGDPYGQFEINQKLVKVAFRMIVGDLIDSEIMQLLPMQFAKNLVENLLGNSSTTKPAEANPTPAPAEPKTDAYAQQQSVQPTQQPMYQQPMQQMNQQPMQQMYQQPMQQMYQQPMYQQPMQMPPMTEMHEQRPRNAISVQPAQFQAFDDGLSAAEKKNIGLIMDLPLQVTVELGRTNKLIKDVLEFGTGSIIELDKLAGDPVDILVNGKAIAKGEVVVIDESFGVRITDIIHPSKRL